MKEVDKIAKALDISYDEALQVYESDKKIDKGAKLFELPQELKAGAKKARQADRKKTVYDFSKRERKEDADKREIIALLSSTLKSWFKSNSECTYNNCINIEIINPEREITFCCNNRKFKIVLSAPRK